MNGLKVLVLGVGGMLGSAVFRVFSERSEFEVTGTARSERARKFFSDKLAASIVTDVDVLDTDRLASLLARHQPEVVVNCIGLVKQLPSAKDPLVALPINSLFPHRLARFCQLAGARLVHVSTDCVFTGSRGGYVEADPADAQDLYGRSKLLGETVEYENAITLRTSIIGRELSTAHSLVDWFLGQTGAVNGYQNAIFSGLPTDELARIVRDVVIPRPELHGLYHVSAAPISKFDLLRQIRQAYGKEIEIVPVADPFIDRSLDSSRLSQATGYKAAPWPQLISQMYEFDTRKER